MKEFLLIGTVIAGGLLYLIATAPERRLADITDTRNGIVAAQQKVVDAEQHVAEMQRDIAADPALHHSAKKLAYDQCVGGNIVGLTVTGYRSPSVFFGSKDQWNRYDMLTYAGCGVDPHPGTDREKAARTAAFVARNDLDHAKQEVIDARNAVLDARKALAEARASVVKYNGPNQQEAAR